MNFNGLKAVHYIAFLLVIVGALNWGLIGAFNINLVERLLSSMPHLVKAVYISVGLAALLVVGTHMTDCKPCSSGK